MSSSTTVITSDKPCIMVVDGSKLARTLIEKVLLGDLPSADVLVCDSGAAAIKILEQRPVDLLTTSLNLPDMDGDALAAFVRDAGNQSFIPIIVVSGDVNARLERREISPHVTDYFDKSSGPQALSAFIRGYIQPDNKPTGTVLYVEDSKVVALKTRRMMEAQGLTVTHVVSVEDALAIIETAKAEGKIAADIVLTDVYLKGGLTGKELLEEVRGKMGYGKGELPILVMTGDDNPVNQSALIKAGANDLVQKPMEERLLMTKLSYQLRVSQSARLMQSRRLAAA